MFKDVEKHPFKLDSYKINNYLCNREGACHVLFRSITEKQSNKTAIQNEYIGYWSQRAIGQ